MSLRELSRTIGFIFIVMGVLGFIPGITDAELLIGIFQVNGLLNCFHILTGLIAFGASRKDQKITRYFFQIAGFVYLAVALAGFAHGNELVFGILANNSSDSWLHLWSSVVLLYIGLLYRNRRSK